MRIVSALAVAFGCATAHVATAQTAPSPPERGYPARPVRYVVPFPAGSSVDTVSRLVAQKLNAALSQAVVVENRAGAAGNIGADLVAKSAPDGHTVLHTIGSIAASPALYSNLPFDPVRDFAPIAQVSAMAFVMLVHPSLPARSVSEFVQLARARPGQLSFGSSGVGSLDHLSGELLNSVARIAVFHVAYKGGPAVQNDLIGGQITMGFSGLASGTPHVRTGRLRALAVTTLTRAAILPDLPTLAESGYPSYEVVNSSALYAPANTPRPIVSRLNAEVARILRLPDIKERFDNLGVEAVGGTPEELAASLKTDVTKWARVIRSANIRPAD